jgi:predicted nucleic acid-binding protein
VIYDALIARAAEKAGAERLLTLNEGDFRRVWPASASILLVP